MRVSLSRDSVAAGDDVRPHDEIAEAEAADVLSLVLHICAGGYLPSIQGGKTTWVAVSHEPLVVCAQEWSLPRLISWRAPEFGDMMTVKGAIRLHFSYLAQVDPVAAWETLKRTALRAR